MVVCDGSIFWVALDLFWVAMDGRGGYFLVVVGGGWWWVYCTWS